jgi:hypothetical protein
MAEVNKTPIEEDFSIEANLGGGFRAVGAEERPTHPIASRIGNYIGRGAKWAVCAAFAGPITIAETFSELNDDSDTEPDDLS